MRPAPGRPLAGAAGPSDYNPISNPAGAKARRNEVLDAMADQNMLITPARAAAANNRTPAQPGRRSVSTVRIPYFFDYVQSEPQKKYGVNTVRRGGLKFTRRSSRRNGAAALSALDSNLYAGGPSRCAGRSSPRNGDIKAMVSSTNYEGQQVQPRRPGPSSAGSTFKVFTLTTAIHEASTRTRPTTSPEAALHRRPHLRPLEVHTYGDSHKAARSTSIDATLASTTRSSPGWPLTWGPDKIRRHGAQDGHHHAPRRIPGPETLGGLTIGVSPWKWPVPTRPASGGVVMTRPRSEKVVFPNGEVDRPGRSKPVRVLSEAEAYEVTKILHDNITSGTGTGAYTGCGSGPARPAPPTTRSTPGSSGTSRT